LNHSDKFSVTGSGEEAAFLLFLLVSGKQKHGCVSLPGGEFEYPGKVFSVFGMNWVYNTGR
jgi:hypothetical protein